MIDVYYPYFQREAKWEELRYSLRSLEKHLQAEFRVWIVGDLPGWIDPTAVHFIPHKRCEGMQENTTYDAISKILLFISHPDTSLYFIRMYDDIYLLQNADLVEIGQFRAMYDWKSLPEKHGTGTWWEQLRRTLRFVTRKGYHGWNTETHLPELFNKEKLKWAIDIYDALKNRLLTSTLYFNTFYPNIEPLLFSKEYAIQFYDNHDNQFYTSSEGNLQEKCKGKMYLNHNDKGLNENLKKFLMQRFPDKSRFER